MRIHLSIYGENLRKRDFENKIEDEFYNNKEVDDITGYSDEDFPNFSDVENPARVGIQHELQDYQEWYVAFIEKYYQEMIAHGATEFTLMTNVFYADQCNFEIFDQEMMSRLGKYPIAFPVSVYNTRKSELKEIRSFRVENTKAIMPRK